MNLLTSGRPTVPEYHEEDPYSILGLSTRIKSRKKIEARYKELCLDFHPDRLLRWEFTPGELAGFKKFFDLMNKAKETLVDKKLYKQFRDSGVFDPPTDQTITGAANIELDKLFCKCCREIRDEQHNDFMEVMRRGVKEHLIKISAELLNACGEIKRMRNIKKRTHSAAFEKVSQNIIKDLITQTKCIEKQSLVYKRMLELLKDCSYDFDKPDLGIGGFTFTSSAAM